MVFLQYPGGGGTPYDRLYGEAPPERGAFLRFRYKKGYGKMTFLRYFKGSLKKAGVSKSYWYFKGVRKTPGNPRENAGRPETPPCI